MKKTRNVRLRLALCLTAILVAGCGGGGGGGGGDTPAPANYAPASPAGDSVQITDGKGFSQQLQFAQSGDTYSEFTPGSNNLTHAGTYQYSASGNTATLTLTDSTTSEVTTLALHFSSATAGTYSATSSLGNNSSGTFSGFHAATAGTGSGATPGGGAGGGSSSSGNGSAGAPPGSGGLDGHVLTLVRSTGQTHTYTFTGSTFVDSDPPEEGEGTYSYSRTGSTAQLTLAYGSASKTSRLVGDRHDITLTFTSETAGTYTSVYHTSDGDNLEQDGTFQFTQ